MDQLAFFNHLHLNLEQTGCANFSCWISLAVDFCAGWSLIRIWMMMVMVVLVESDVGDFRAGCYRNAHSRLMVVDSG